MHPNNDKGGKLDRSESREKEGIKDKGPRHGTLVMQALIYSNRVLKRYCCHFYFASLMDFRFRSGSLGYIYRFVRILEKYRDDAITTLPDTLNGHV